MRTTAILLIILALGLVVTGCSKVTQVTPTNSDTQTTANVVDDLGMEDTITNPDIGTLDDTNVSDELPQ